MTSLTRAIAIATFVALGATMVPASITPAGGIELDDLCASSDCLRKPSAFCMDGDQMIYDYKNIVS